jgi:hypothetical protein
MFHAICRDLTPAQELEQTHPVGQAALDAVAPRAGWHQGRPMMRASPHIVQPHSWQSPSSASGQLAGSAWNCSNSRSSLHPVQYLFRCVILATSSWRCIKGPGGELIEVDADSGTLSG